MLAIMGVSVVTYLVASIVDTGIALKLFPLGMGIVMYGIARLICANDPRAFRYMMLRAKTKMLHRSRKFWHSGSYSPVAHRRR